ncbi:hypothetical protein RJ639_045100 [Escallonia herrerae]|uniref:Plastid division protein PDV2 n=1 Tax=Escallonia herrerae TaxID=1293975 RepID=A0AA89B0I0_9ASTE|nr:hypothetical protein RJ639_045100 [Escallonia herrerae]
MDEEGIGLVLARASELRSKITNCIHKPSTTLQAVGPNAQKEDQEAEEKDPTVEMGEAGEEEEAAEETLLHIRDALESLEAQLSSLQALQQQQWYEKEAALAEIDYSRKKLLKKLKEYKGDDLEVIHEATAFASETVEENNDLLLPPYPSRPGSLLSDTGYLARFPSTQKLAQNGFKSSDAATGFKKSLPESDRNQVQSESKSSFKGVKLFINVAAKTVLTLVGVLSVLSLAGFEPKISKRGTKFKILGLLQQQGSEEKGAIFQCPPGRVLVVEGGETRCLVKERVEIPFDSVVATPDVNYGCG